MLDIDLMRLKLLGFVGLVLLCACYESHPLLTPPPPERVEFMQELNVERIAGAREGPDTILLVQARVEDAEQISTWQVNGSTETISLEPMHRIEGTRGARLGSVARDDGRIALIVRTGVLPDWTDVRTELLLFDAEEGETMARYVFPGTVADTHVELSGTEILLYYRHQLDGEVRMLWQLLTLDGTELREAVGGSGELSFPSLTESVRFFDGESPGEELMRSNLGPAFDIILERPDVDWTADGETVAGWGAGPAGPWDGFWVDGVLRSSGAEIPTFVSHSGLSYASADGRAVFSLFTDLGVVWAIVERSGDVFWETFPSPGGRVTSEWTTVSHAGELHQGVFFIRPTEEYFTRDPLPPVIEYVGVRR